MSQPFEGGTIKEKFFLSFFVCMEEHFLVCFYIPRELPSPTIWVVSHSSGPFFDLRKRRMGGGGGKLSKRKKREAKLSSQGHHLKETKQKVVALSI